MIGRGQHFRGLMSVGEVKSQMAKVGRGEGGVSGVAVWQRWRG
jgi:hypothetical protein